jgi:hypothetical protein
MAEATLDDVIHRLKLNNRNTNRALRMSAKEQAEAFGSVMGVAVTSLAGAFDASISRLVTTSSMTVDENVTSMFEESNEKVADSVSSGDMFESPAYTVTLNEFDRMNETLYELRDISADGFDKLFNALAGDSLDEAERRRRQSLSTRESSTVFRDNNQRGGGGGAGGLFARLAQGLGLGAGLGFGLGGIGIGLGAAAAGTGVGVGIGAAGIAGLLFAVNELDGAAVRENVGQILAIKTDVDNIGDVAVVAAALGGIGAGLAAFGAGSVLASGGDMLANFVNQGWADSIRDNVVTLLSIPEAVGGNLSMLFEGGAVALALGGLGVGIGLFGAGGAIASAGDAIGNFTNENWAQNIKDNVVTLLSIPEEVGGNLSTLFKGGAVTLALSGLSAGLALFAFGEGISQASQALDIFREANFADRVKDNVTTLMSISELSFGDVARFIRNMGILSGGLVAFAIGEAGNQVAQAIDIFRETSFADRIVDNVSKLLEIVNLADEGKALKFLGAMTAISGGLALFSTANAFDALAGAGARILNFFSGNQSPIKAITSLTDNVEDLQKVSGGLESISDALNKFSSIQFNVRDADFEGLIKNIQKAVPLIESLSTGQSKLFGRDIPSLLDPSLRLDELVVAMDQLNRISSGAGQLGDIDVNTTSVRAEEIKMLQSQLNDNAASPTVVVAPSTQNNSTVNQANTVVNEVSMSPFPTARADSYL